MLKRSCAACKAKDQTITALAEQIEWLRLQLGTPWLERRKHDLNRAPDPSPGWALEHEQWVSDDEEDIKHMESVGLIAPDAARAALEQIGALNTDILVEG